MDWPERIPEPTDTEYAEIALGWLQFIQNDQMSMAEKMVVLEQWAKPLPADDKKLFWQFVRMIINAFTTAIDNPEEVDPEAGEQFREGT